MKGNVSKVNSSHLATKVLKAVENCEKLENKGVPNGYAPLNEDGQIPKQYVEYLCDIANDKEVFIAVHGETPVQNIFLEVMAGKIVKLKVPNTFIPSDDDSSIIHDDYLYLDVAHAYLCGYGGFDEVTNTITFAGIVHTKSGLSLLVSAECYAISFKYSISYGWNYLPDKDGSRKSVACLDIITTKGGTVSGDSFTYNDGNEKGDYTVATRGYVDSQFQDIKGTTDGYAPLDENGKIPVKYLYNNDNPETVTYTTYGVSIDLSNSNPETSVTYTDDAVGMSGGSSAWYKMSIFDRIKPCLFKNGKVVGYLDPKNFGQFEDGSVADITSGDAGDVMIEIPKIGYKISKIGTYLTVQITDDPNKDGFSYKAHTREREGDREKLYIGAFLGSNKANKLRSISGVAPQNNTTLTDFRIQAKANGAGYDLFPFYPMTLLQCLYLVKYKNLDSQTALGQGYTGDIDWAVMAKNTGATIDKGMDYGSTDNMEQMKFLGIEDFWGNLYQWIDGLVSTSDYHGLVATDNFNDDGTGYTDIGQLTPSYVGGYMKEPQGTNEAGFIIKAAGGSSSTYFGDFTDFLGGCVPIFGGDFDDEANAGAFRLDVHFSPSSAYDYIGGRLIYL